MLIVVMFVLIGILCSQICGRGGCTRGDCKLISVVGYI